MGGLSTIGIIHTVIGLVALGYGAVALLQAGRIDPATRAGRVYLVATGLAALTAFALFRRGFGPPHVLALLTLLALAVGAVAGRRAAAGSFAARLVETVAYSSTFLFHLIPGITESATRLPPSAPLVASPEAPALQAVYGVLLVLFAIGLTLQIRRLRATRR